ncbi:hypothetical protein GF377_00215 [candidate division GN15 bacterium]|nr:hypothetical protein [candidate division GN15 bacterium]
MTNTFSILSRTRCSALMVMAIMAIGLIGCGDDDGPVGPEPLAPNSITVTAITPPAEGPLLFNEEIEVTVEYNITDDSGAYVTGNLLASGTTAPNQPLRRVKRTPKGSGTATETLTITRDQIRIDGIRVLLMGYFGDQLDSVTVPVTFDYTGAFIGNVSIAPGSPETIAVNDMVTVTYDCGTILTNGFHTWAQGWKDGRYPQGLAYQASGTHYGRQTITRTFTLRNSGEVDEVYISMKEGGNPGGPTLVDHSLTVDYTFQ